MAGGSLAIAQSNEHFARGATAARANAQPERRFSQGQHASWHGSRGHSSFAAALTSWLQFLFKRPQGEQDCAIRVDAKTPGNGAAVKKVVVEG